MQPSDLSRHDSPPHNQTPETRFASNDVRLSPRGWVFATMLIVVTCWFIPFVWQTIEPLRMGRDYRIPYRLGNDYWNFARTCREVCREQPTLLVGDSVIWGHYVDSQGTLSHYLNEQVAGHHFANLGVDGIHSVALSGLVQYYGQSIHGQRVILNCNPLWMSSPRHDLSTDKEAPFNHPNLVPQFRPWIPCYKASISERLGITIAHHTEIFNWADHLRIAYFGGDNLPVWSTDHPYENPLQQVTLELPSPDEPPSPQPDTRPWTEKGIRPLTPQWVALDASLQWRFFRQTVRQLQQRGNQVFVIVGPLNEHMLTPAGLAEYNTRKQAIVAWHNEQGVGCYAPPVLPSQVYADLSHPTAEGYAQLAETLLQHSAFRAFLQ